jgi:hypothetical protein
MLESMVLEVNRGWFGVWPSSCKYVKRLVEKTHKELAMEKKSLISNRSSKKVTVSKPGATKVSATKLAKQMSMAPLHRVASPARLKANAVIAASTRLTRY